MSFFDPGMAEQIWSAHFTFAGMRASEWGKKEASWKKIALETAEVLSRGKNIGIRLSTGGGKTIIAILTATALGARTLFLTPTRYLTDQHEKLLKVTLGCSLPARVITGETSPGRRIWNNQSERFIFSTGEAFYSALAAEDVSLEEFDLIVFDEFHLARGKYAYTLITPECIKSGIPRLGLSASPGGTEEEVELVLLNTGIECVSNPQIKSPPKSDNYYFLPLTPEMERADKEGWKVLGEKLVNDLREANLRIPEQWHCTAQELKRLRRDISALPTTPNTKKLRKLFAKYRLYLYGYYVFMTGSYYAFSKYAEGLAVRKRPSDRMLLGEPIFRRLIATAEHYRDEHPKVTKLARLLKNVRRSGGKAVVFFADKNTARYCREFLDECCILTEMVFGGADKSVLQQQEAIDSLKDGRITAVLATSVLRVGVDIPEVDLVLNYSVEQSGIARLQSGGWTGRMRPGHIAHLVLDHDLDRLVFFAVHKQTKKITELSARELRPVSERKGQLSLFVSS